MPFRAGDIAVWVLVAALLATLWPRRDAPPLEHHSWRQSLAASVARSYRCGAPFARPRVDACGARPEDGTVAMEFPGYAWLMAAASRPFGPHGGERLVVFGCAAWALLALAGLAGWLASGLDSTAASAGGALAAGTCLAAPFFVFYSGTLLPDGVAYGLGLGGAALVLAGDAEGRPGWMAAGSLLLSAGIATKLVAAPLLALTGASLLLRALAAPRGARGAALGRLALHLALAAALPAAWYLGWMPRLQGSSTCRLFWLAPQDGLAGLDRALPGKVHFRLATLLGEPGRVALYLLAVPAALALRWRSLSVVALWLASAALWALLGWHHDVHDYDGLLFLPPAALTAGPGLAWLVSRLPPPARAPAAAALPLLLVLPRLAWARGEVERWRWDEPEVPALALLASELDLLLPPEAAVLAPGAGQDPRLSYFAGRATLNSDRLDCGRKHPLDCAVVLEAGRPACGRAVTSVFLPDATLTCGLAGGSLAPLRARLATSLSPGDGRLVPGLGRYLGFAARHRAFGRARVDLWFEAAGDRLDLSRIVAAAPPRGPPLQPPPGTLYAVRVPLAEPGSFRASIDGVPIEGLTADAGALEARCVARPAP